MYLNFYVKDRIKLLPNYHYATYKGCQALATVYIDEIVFQMKLDINDLLFKLGMRQIKI